MPDSREMGEATELADQTVLCIVTRSPEETADVGRRLGEVLRVGDVVLLSGTLGAGKTTLAQGIAAGMGIDDYVTSPTFVLVNEYRPGRRGVALFHADLYRIGTPAEAFELLLDDYVRDGAMVVEWAERAPEAAPTDHLLIRLEPTGEDERRITITAHGERHRELLERIAAQGRTTW